jgi:hypothetical protein
MRGLRDVGNCVVVPARDAEPTPPLGGRQPVADVIVRIAAETSEAAVARQAGPCIAARWLEGSHDFEPGVIAEPMAATTARPIFEIDDVVADLAAE